MAGVILDAIGEFCLSTNSQKLKLVRIVAFDVSMIKHLLTEMKRLAQDGIEKKSWKGMQLLAICRSTRALSK